MSLSQMAYRCPNSKVVCNGKLHGYRLVFNIHADIIKTNNKNDIVPVVVWSIADSDWRMLDMYEGYPSYYVKEIVNVILDGGKKENAIVYVMADNRKGICPPASNYFNCIFNGYLDHGIDVNYLFDALDYSYDNKTEYNQYKTRGTV
jgi:gamma-glutamylcyclotransferase (GGCT)/AIG2-like uncharacterized protein YtfP